MRCASCSVVNPDASHFCAHCGLAFPSECAVCYRATAAYLHCGHPLCLTCMSAIPRRECPVCAAPVSAARAGVATADLTALLADLRLFRCDLVGALYYRCTERRFCAYDARHLVRPILDSDVWARKARALIRGWDALVARARDDALATDGDAAEALMRALQAESLAWPRLT